MDEENKEVLSGRVTLNFLQTYLPIWDPIKEFSTTVDACISPKLALLPWMNPPVQHLHTTVTFATEKKAPLRILIKTPAGEFATHTRKRKYFHKETLFYDELNPKLNRLVPNVKINVPPFAAASISDVCDEPLETFVALREVSKCGYGPPTTSLDFVHASLVVKELAKLHALGWLYKKARAVLSLQVLHPLLTEAVFTSDNLSSLHNDTLVMTLALPEVQSAMGDKCALTEKILSSGITAAQLIPVFISHAGFSSRDIPGLCESELQGEDGEDESPWATLCHGDISKDSLLFRCNADGVPQYSMLINWGCVRECCPSTDLAMFLSVCELTNLQEQELMEIYHIQFTAICEQANKECPHGFTLQALIRKVQESKLFAKLVNLLRNHLPVIITPQVEMGDKINDSRSWAIQLEQDAQTVKQHVS